MLQRIYLHVTLSICLAACTMAMANDAATPANPNPAARLETAFQLPEAQRPASWTVLKVGELGIVLDRKPDGVELLSLFDLAKHQQLLAPKSLPLFAIALRDLAKKEDVQCQANAGWEHVHVNVSKATQQIEIGWRTPKDKRLGDLRVTATGLLDASSGSVHWNMKVDQVGKTWSVRRVVFPQIALDASLPEFTFLYPWGPGQLRYGVWSGPFSGPYYTYPSHCATMQFMAGYSPRLSTGLYFGMHDPCAGVKDVVAEGREGDKAIAVAFDIPAEDMESGGNGYVSSGKYVWQLLHGDWFDASVIYRNWVRQHAAWYPKLGPDGRADTPKWMRELSVWLQRWGGPGEIVSPVTSFAQSMGVPLGLHWYGWHSNPFDNDYPHYLPAKNGFADAVRSLQQKGVYVMPYINGRLWDTRDKGAQDFEFTRKASPAAAKNEPDKPAIEMYGSKETDGSPVRFAVMCPSTKLWQETIHQIVLPLMNEYGVKGVYIDQVAAERPVLCIDKTHGHPTGGGHWWVESYSKMLQDIRRAKPADDMLTTECNAEPYIKDFDGYLTWHWCRDRQVPAFPAVYGGAIQMFGRAYRGGETQDLALQMKAGQQFVFGEQIGWFDPEVIQKPRAADFLKQLVQVRWQLRRYFYAGEMARPPKLQGDIPTVRADWQWDNPGWVTTNAVMTGAWTIPAEHRCIFLFANVSDQPVTAKLQCDATAYGFSAQQVKIHSIVPNGAGESFTSPSAIRRDVTFPARSAMAWEISQ